MVHIKNMENYKTKWNPVYQNENDQWSVVYYMKISFVLHERPEH